jgi:hypothetical protein
MNAAIEHFLFINIVMANILLPNAVLPNSLYMNDVMGIFCSQLHEVSVMFAQSIWSDFNEI